MNDKPRVLVGAPIFSGMKYCYRQFLDGLRNLSYGDFDILLVDNSEGEEFFNELLGEGDIEVLRDKPENKTKMERVVSSRNRIIDYALENNYDYVLMMDSDVVPPKDIIEGLISCGKDVVSGLYINYFVSSGQVKILPVAWIEIGEEEFEKLKEFLPGIGSRQEIRRHMTMAEADSGNLFKVLYPSAGCMLISRKVSENKNIRYGLMDMKKIYGENTKLKTGDDIYFFEMVRRNGFEMFCNTKMKCDHLVSGKYKEDSNGNLLHSGLS